MNRFIRYASTALLMLLILINASPVSAATSSGLSITPRKNLTVSPGQTVKDKLTIGNLNKNADLDITFNVIDFTYMNDSGTPKLFLGKGNPQTAWSIKPFIHLPQTVVIPAGQNKTIDYSVTVPANQGAGSYYGAIQYATGGPDGGNVSLSASGVSLVFVSVPGIVKEQMSLKRFGVYEYDKDAVSGKYLSIATHKPSHIGYTLQNDGNVAESPAGSISVKYMFGGKHWDISNINSTSSLALIGQSRLFVNCFETTDKVVDVNGSKTITTDCKAPSFLPGRYTASLDVFFGQNGNNTHEVTGDTSFWYLPPWFIAVCVVVLLVIVGGIWYVSRKLRRATRKSSRR